MPNQPQYLRWDEKTVTDSLPEDISGLYDRGYVFTRIGRGVMHQTRSVRIDLKKFSLSSENRRILKKVSDIGIIRENIPYRDYAWPVAKLAKDFYSVKFGDGVMSAAKIKEMLTDAAKSNFNSILIFDQKTERLGYTICYENVSILHYCYPFYELDKSPKDMGLGMMTLAADYARRAGLRYVYLGSLQRPTDTYKFQFSGMEWFDGKKWRDDIDAAKEILKKIGLKK